MTKTESPDACQRVLFLTSAAFNKVTGGGVTFSNLFSGWPKGCIATVHNDPVPVTMDVCEQYYRLGDAEIHRRGIWRYLLPAGSVATTATGHNALPVRESIVRLMARFGRRLVFGSGLSDQGVLTKQLEEWVERFRPDVIYTILGTNGMMELTRELSWRFNLPVVVHLMDDWPAVAYRGGLWSWTTRRYMQKLLTSVLRMSAVRMCISSAMGEAYQRRYGLPFQVFQNPVDTQKWKAFHKQDVTVRSPARLVYIGSILQEAQLRSIVDCCHAVARLRREGVDVVFDIYSPAFQTAAFRDSLLVDPGIRLQDAPCEDEAVFYELHSADVLLLPVNFDLATIRYVRYSMPTKVPAYLFSGTPVLVYAPDEVAQAQYARLAGWGHVVGKRDSAALMAAIRTMLTDVGLRERLSSAALTTVREQHDATRVRAQFQQALRRASARQRP